MSFAAQHIHNETVRSSPMHWSVEYSLTADDLVSFARLVWASMPAMWNKEADSYKNNGDFSAEWYDVPATETPVPRLFRFQCPD